MERRKLSISKPSPLPKDYLKMVAEVFLANFDSGLKIYNQYCPSAFIEAQGEIGSDEIILAVSLMNQGQMTATTVYASSDFDPKASSPSVQDLLSACLDAAGAVFSTLLSPDSPHMITLLAEGSLASLENIPFLWTEIEADTRRIFIKLDKSNITLDTLADEWLEQHDPEFIKEESEKERLTKNLFFTGPKSKGSHDDDSGQIH